MRADRSNDGVLHVIVPQREGAVGGSDLHIIDLAVAQRDHGAWRPMVLAPRAPQDYLERLADASVPTIGFSPTRLGRLFQLPAVAGLGVVHAHGYEANYLAAGLRKLSRRWSQLAAVVTGHGWIETSLWLRLKSALDRYAAGTADVCIASATAHVHRFRVPAERRLVVRNGVRPSCLGGLRPKFEVTEARKRLAIPAGRFVVGVVGRLSSEKRIDLVLTAAQHLLTTGAAIHVLVVGGGGDRQRLEALTVTLGITDHVTFTGLLRDVSPAYTAMDVLVQASDTEGTPRSILEAMAYHVPVVATDVGDVHVLLDQGHGGLLVQPGDAAAVAAGVRTVLDRPEGAERRAERAAELQAQRFTVDAMRDQVHDAYELAVATATARMRRR